MKDFTIRIYNLPFDHEYGGKDMILQAQMWNFVEKSVKKHMIETEGEGNTTMIDALEKEKIWEVIDVTFGKSDFEEEDMLELLDEKDRIKKTKIR